MSGKTALRILVAISFTGSFMACGSDQQEDHRYGDSRYGKIGSPLTPSDPSLPLLDFDENAKAGSIALTFDDGPDDVGYTKQVLDTLKSKGVQATFFINSQNAVDVKSSSTATALVQRMVSEGHDVGNHTVHHYDLGSSSTDVLSEIKGVDDLLHSIAPSAFKVRLFRGPYGNPWYGPQARLDYVAPIAANYGVHIGWDFDSTDFNCTTSTCVHDNVINAVDSGKSGIVLMHCINQYTASALASIIDDLKTRGKKFTKVETLVVAKYGKPSRQLFFCKSDSDCYNGERCSGSHCGSGSTADSGTDTSTDTSTDTAKDTATDTSVTDTSVTDTATDTGTGSQVKCSAFTVSSGSVTNSATACSGTTPALASSDSTVATWSGAAVAHATYHSPYDSAHVTGAQLTVAYRGDDKTEPLWYWWVHNPAIALPNGWDLVGDNSWAGNWVATSHTFTIPTPSKYVDGSGNVLVRFGTSTSTNIAELDQMVMSFSGTTGSVDSGTTDTGSADSSLPDTATSDTSATDTAPSDTATTDTGSDTAATDTASSDTAKVTDTLRCTSLTTVSGTLYSSSSTACSGTTPALATIDGTDVGWSAKTGSPKSSAYATYLSPVVAASVTAMKLDVAFLGDDKTEPAWFWYAKNVTTGAWELIGDNSWAPSWATTAHSFTVSNPSRYVAADRTVQILFTTTSSTNDAELDQMVLEVTH